MTRYAYTPGTIRESVDHNIMLQPDVSLAPAESYQYSSLIVNKTFECYLLGLIENDMNYVLAQGETTMLHVSA